MSCSIWTQNGWASVSSMHNCLIVQQCLSIGKQLIIQWCTHTIHISKIPKLFIFSNDFTELQSLHREPRNFIQEFLLMLMWTLIDCSNSTIGSRWSYLCSTNAWPSTKLHLPSTILTHWITSNCVSNILKKCLQCSPIAFSHIWRRKVRARRSMWRHYSRKSRQWKLSRNIWERMCFFFIFKWMNEF